MAPPPSRMRTLRQTVCFPFGNSPFRSTYLMSRHRAVLPGNIHIGFQQGTRMKGDHSACWDHRFLSRAGISSLASTLTADCKLAKVSDDDLFPLLKGGFEDVQNPIKHLARLVLREPGLLMNPSGNLRLSHPVSLPFRFIPVLLQVVAQGLFKVQTIARSIIERKWWWIRNGRICELLSSLKPWRIVRPQGRRWNMLARGLSLLVFAAIAGCTTMPMPNIPNEPPLKNLALNGPIIVALSPFRIKTS